MGRWSPSVLPEVPRYVPPVDIGSGLRSLADGLSDGFARRDRNAREQAQVDREYDFENQRRIERALDRQRQGQQDERQAKLDGIAASDRKRRLEGDYLRTRSTARDEGYVSGAARQERQAGARAIQSGRGSVGGAAGMMAGGIGDMLLSASTGDESLTLTRPDDTEEQLFRDPTQTKEVLDAQRAMARQRAIDGARPAPRDPVQDELAEYEGKLKIDQRYRVNDFAPQPPRGGSGGGGGANDPRLAMADRMFDNASQMAARLEREEPKAPTFDPLTRPSEGSPALAKWKSDSAATTNSYTTARSSWQRRKNDASNAAEEWFSIGDALARDAVGARGGDSVATQQQVNAQRAITEVQARVNAKLAEVAGDPVATDKIRKWYAEQVQSINQAYGIRPKPED
jgi:hypothetical protein